MALPRSLRTSVARQHRPSVAMGSGGGTLFEDIELPHAWCEGVVVSARGDADSARVAFQRARAEDGKR